MKRKPNGYWNNYDNCENEINKYNSIYDLQNNNNSLYKSLVRNNWDDLLNRIRTDIKPNGYWDIKENCREESLKFNSRSELEKNCSSAYEKSRKNGWLDEFFPKKTLTKEECKEESLNYKTKSEFHKNNIVSYGKSYRSGWLDEFFPKKIWSYKNCKEESLKFNSRSEFRNKSNGAYEKSRKNNWLDEFYPYEGIFTNKYIGYVFEFTDKSAYVGITSREKRRTSDHLSQEESAVFQHIKITGLKPIKKILFPLTESHIAKELEGIWLEKYIENGWNILNKAATGSLGAITRIWTYENCKEESLKYDTKNDFRINSHMAYISSYRNGWLMEFCQNMIKREQKGKWQNKKICKKESLKYKTRKEFCNKSVSAYNVSWKNGWLDEFFPKKMWTKEECRKESLKSNSRVEFRKNNQKAYYKSTQSGWMDEFFPKK